MPDTDPLPPALYLATVEVVRLDGLEIEVRDNGQGGAKSDGQGHGLARE